MKDKLYKINKWSIYLQFYCEASEYLFLFVQKLSRAPTLSRLFPNLTFGLPEKLSCGKGIFFYWNSLGFPEEDTNNFVEGWTYLQAVVERAMPTLYVIVGFELSASKSYSIKKTKKSTTVNSSLCTMNIQFLINMNNYRATPVISFVCLVGICRNLPTVI